MQRLSLITMFAPDFLPIVDGLYIRKLHANKLPIVYRHKLCLWDEHWQPQNRLIFTRPYTTQLAHQINCRYGMHMHKNR